MNLSDTDKAAPCLTVPYDGARQPLRRRSDDDRPSGEPTGTVRLPEAIERDDVDLSRARARGPGRAPRHLAKRIRERGLRKRKVGRSRLRIVMPAVGHMLP